MPYIETDAQFYSEAAKRVKGASPGDEHWEQVVRWESGTIAAIDPWVWRATTKRPTKKGQVFEYGGVLWKVLDPEPGWMNAVLAIKYEGWRTEFVCGWLWLKRCLHAVSLLLLRTAWAWSLLEYEIGAVPGWHSLKLCRWWQKRRTGAEG